MSEIKKMIEEYKDKLPNVSQREAILVQLESHKVMFGCEPTHLMVDNGYHKYMVEEGFLDLLPDDITIVVVPRIGKTFLKFYYKLQYYKRVKDGKDKTKTTRTKGG